MKKNRFKNKKRIVVKIGSSSLQHKKTGQLDFIKLEKLVRELCDLKNQDLDVCLVSSGAIAVGRKMLGITKRPKNISTKQACAAVGQASLMMTYQKLFAEYHQQCGQVLMTKKTMTDNVSRKNAQNTFEELFRLGVIPIVNENDTVAIDELELEINAGIDYEQIYNTAVNELGMVYPERDQVITYDAGVSEYVKQYHDIP